MSPTEAAAAAAAAAAATTREEHRIGNPFLEDMFGNNFLSRRPSEDDYCSPSEITSIFSQDYLADTDLDSQPSGLEVIEQRIRAVDWDTFTNRLSEWNIKMFKVCTPSFVHHLCLPSRERPIELKSDIESVRGTSVVVATRQSTEKQAIKCLDGLRGVACLFVFNFHFLYPFTKTIIHGYGAPDGDGVKVFTHAHQMPYLSIPYRGRAMVSVFFAISGYVLSSKVLRNFRSGNVETARRALTSSVFRRALRLYLPPTLSMFMVMIIVWVGMFLSEEQIYSGEYARYIGGSWEEHPPRAQLLSNQFSHWFNMWLQWSNPFTWRPFYNLYDPHTWTIPLEFRSSIVLFAVLLGTAKMKSTWRICTTFLMTCYCLYIGRWDIAIFLGGMWICEVDLTTGVWEQQYGDVNHRGQPAFYPADTPSSSPTVLHEKPDTVIYPADLQEVGDRDDDEIPTIGLYAISTFQWTTFLLSLYLLSFPDNLSEKTPGYSLLAIDLTPSAYTDACLFWHAIGAIGCVYSVTNIEVLRRVFAGFSPFQYLGKISFGFYLVHGPILHSVGFMLMPEVWKLFAAPPASVVGRADVAAAAGNINEAIGIETDQSFVAGLFVGWLCLLALSIWCADLFWRAIDMPCTKLARKIEMLSSTEKED